MAVFKNRVEAGKKLAEILESFRGTDAIVLGLPRGGVIVAKEIAHALNLPLDIIVTRKIGAPDNEEYAIGAIDLDGDGIWNEYEVSFVDKQWLAEKVAQEKAEAKRRQTLYRHGRSPLNLSKKIVIIVDDGIATGHTIHAALRYAKKQGAKKIIIATPVAHPLVKSDLEETVEVYTLETPPVFSSVGQWYKDFPQVEDDEVIKALAPTPIVT